MTEAQAIAAARKIAKRTDDVAFVVYVGGGEESYGDRGRSSDHWYYPCSEFDLSTHYGWVRDENIVYCTADD